MLFSYLYSFRPCEILEERRLLVYLILIIIYSLTNSRAPHSWKQIFSCMLCETSCFEALLFRLYVFDFLIDPVYLCLESPSRSLMLWSLVQLYDTSFCGVDWDIMEYHLSSLNQTEHLVPIHWGRLYESVFSIELYWGHCIPWYSINLDPFELPPLNSILVYPSLQC